MRICKFKILGAPVSAKLFYATYNKSKVTIPFVYRRSFIFNHNTNTEKIHIGYETEKSFSEFMTIEIENTDAVDDIVKYEEGDII